MSNSVSEIIKAIAAVKSTVVKLKKNGENKGQSYNFASVDDFFTEVRPIMAENGLINIIDETSVEFVPSNKSVIISYLITTYHTSGESLPPVKRTVEVYRNAAQAFGAAQAYILKQYLRGLFLISTGEKDDPDFGTQQNTVTENSGPSEYDIRLACDKISKAQTLDGLAEIWKSFDRDLKVISEVAEAKEATKKALQQKAETDPDKIIGDYKAASEGT